jgi:hypothetical protein
LGRKKTLALENLVLEHTAHRPVTHTQYAIPHSVGHTVKSLETNSE